MNFLNRTGRRTKVFVTSTAVANVLLTINPTPSVATAAQPLPRVAGSVTSARTAPVHVVTTVNPTPSIAAAARPLPRRPGVVTLGTHTFQPNVVLTVNPTVSVVTLARSLPRRPGVVVVRDAAQSATSLVSETAPPAAVVQARRHQRAGTIANARTAVPNGQAGTPLPPINAVAGGRLAGRPGRTFVLRSAVPPINTSTAGAVRLDIVGAARVSERAAPQPACTRTWTDDPQARPYPPRLARACLHQVAGVIAFAQTPKPPEVVRAERAQEPVVIGAAPARQDAGRRIARHTPFVNGTLGLSPTNPAIVRATHRAVRALPPSLASAIGAAPAVHQTPPTAGIVAQPARLPRRHGVIANTRTATPPSPPLGRSITVPARLPAKCAVPTVTITGSLVGTNALAAHPIVVAAGHAPKRRAPDARVLSTAASAATTESPRVPSTVLPAPAHPAAGRIAVLHTAWTNGPTASSLPGIVRPAGSKPRPGTAGAVHTRLVLLPGVPVPIAVIGRPLPRIAGPQPLVASPQRAGLILVPPPHPHLVPAPQRVLAVAPRPRAVHDVVDVRPAGGMLAPANIVRPAGLPRAAGATTVIALPAGPTPVPRASVTRRGQSAAIPAPRAIAGRTAVIGVIAPPRALLVAPLHRPRSAGQRLALATPLPSPILHDPIPAAYRIAAGRPTPRSAPRPLFTSNPISWAVTGLAPDLPAAVIGWLRQYPGVANAFGETLPSTLKLFGDWNLARATMPYLVYQEVMEGPYSFQSQSDHGQTYAYPTGQFQVSVFAASKRQGRILAQQVAAALNDAPLTFADGVLLELRLDRVHAIPEGAVGAGGSATAYHFALTFLYRVQRSLTFTL